MRKKKERKSASEDEEEEKVAQILIKSSFAFSRHTLLRRKCHRAVEPISIKSVLDREVCLKRSQIYDSLVTDVHLGQLFLHFFFCSWPLCCVPDSELISSPALPHWSLTNPFRIRTKFVVLCFCKRCLWLPYNAASLPISAECHQEMCSNRRQPQMVQ